MRPAILLDTCALIWAAGSPEPALPGQEDLAAALEAGDEIVVSAISAWEIALLDRKGRLRLAMGAGAWWNDMVDRAGLRVIGLDPDLLIASTALPDLRHFDPADCIIIATARENGFRILTRDRRILEYADKGHVMAMAC